MRLKIGLFLSGLILITGCVNKEHTISPGIYEYNLKVTKIEAELMPARISVNFKADGSYKSTWKANVFLLMEEKGDWEVKDGFIRFPNTSVRQIGDSGALGAWERDPEYDIVKYKIRNITENAYEIYVEPPNKRDRMIFEELGIVEGWYTCKKI